MHCRGYERALFMIPCLAKLPHDDVNDREERRSRVSSFNVTSDYSSLLFSVRQKSGFGSGGVEMEGREREGPVMNYDLDHIRRIQTQLAELRCRVCRQEGLALLLRYDGNGGRCLFIAFCKACQLKDPVDPDMIQPLDNQELQGHRSFPAILAKV